MSWKRALELGAFSLAVLVLTTLAPSASASVMGHISFVNCDGGGVTVTITAVNWLPAASVTTGCVAAAYDMTVAFDSGSIIPAEHGTVNDLSPGNGNTGFIAFSGVTFDAAVIGPGVLNTTCSNVFADGLTCSVVAGSPFILAPGTNGTTITLAVSGLAIDASSTTSVWSGLFSTQISGQTPYAIQSTFNAQQSFTTSYSFGGDVGAPEPVSMALIGGGLLALAGLKRLKKPLS